MADNEDCNVTLEEETPIVREKTPKKNGMKIMTVDDSATMRMILKNIITNNIEDAQVLEAADGVECMNQLTEHPDIKIMFLDWNMPKMNGEEVVDTMAGSGAIKQTKVIMATTEGERAKVVEMIKKGVAGYLVKPFQPGKVAELLEQIVKRVK